MGRYEILETVAIADCALDVEGSDLADLFATPARALAELMVDPATIARTLQRQIALEAPSVDVLHRLEISRKVVSLRPIGNIKG